MPARSRQRLLLLLCIPFFLTACQPGRSENGLPASSPTAVLQKASFSPDISKLPAAITITQGEEPAAPAAPVNEWPLPAGDIPAPAGVLVYLPQSNALDLYDVAGDRISTRPLSLEAQPDDTFLVAGSAADGAGSLPLIHFHLGMDETFVSLDDQVMQTLEGVLTGAAGVPGLPMLTYAMAAGYEAGTFRSSLFVTTPQTLSQSNPVLFLNSSVPVAILPLMVTTGNGEAVGVWFTQLSTGVGGRILFPQTHGLFHLDLSNEPGTVAEYVLPEQVFQPAFSADGKILTYQWDLRLYAVKLQQAETFSFPILEESEWGAGGVQVAPDDTHLAWKEAHGTLLGENPDYYPILRISPVEGPPLPAFYRSFFEQRTGKEILDLSPVAWLNGTVLLLELAVKDQVSELWTMDILSQNLAFFAAGNFEGLFYP